MLDRKMGPFFGLLVGLVLAVWLGVRIGEGSYLAVAALSFAAVGAVALVLSRKYHQALLVALILLPGRGLLLGGFGYWDALAGAIAFLWLGRMLMLKELFPPVRGWLTLCGIALYSGILVWHYAANVLGVGTGSEGGLRLAVVAVLAVVICLLIQSGRLSSDGNRVIPFLGLLPGMFEGTIEIVNYLVPRARSITYAIYTNLNWEVLAAMRSSAGHTASYRLAGLRLLGLTLGLLCCAHLGARVRLSIRRMAALSAGIIVALILVLVAGYRGYLMNLLVACGVAFWIRYRFASFWFVLALMSVLAVLSLWHIYVMPLPLPMQRSLSWFPGRWDAAVTAQVAGAWAWRMDIWSRFMRSVFPRHPWLGEGLQFLASQPSYGFTYSLFPERFFVDTQSLHSGVFTTLDFVGIIGLIGLILVSVRALYNSYILLVRQREGLAPWAVWVLAYFMGTQPAFWLTGFFNNDFLPISICAAVIEVIRAQMEKDDAADPAHVQERSTDTIEGAVQRPFLPL